MALAGGAGAAMRLVTDTAIRARLAARLPLGTMTINVLGSLLLGAVTGLVAFHGRPSALQLIAGTGFCGGFTTFSTASFEAVRLLQQRRPTLAATAALGTLFLTVLAAAAGLAATAALPL
jgi:CrcB protein